jgi:hypothetical protein
VYARRAVPPSRTAARRARLSVAFTTFLASGSLASACAHTAPLPAPFDRSELRCRVGAPFPVTNDCFTAGNDYDRGAHGHPLRQDTAIELFVLGCRASADDQSCGALRNEIVSLQLSTPRRTEALALLESMCQAGVRDLCNDLAVAYHDGLGVAPQPAKALELYDRTCITDPRGTGRANALATIAACEEVAAMFRTGVPGVAKDELRAIAADMRVSELTRAME